MSKSIVTKEWKNIKGYEKSYKVSNYGEVKSKRRVVYAMIDGEMQPSYVTKEVLMNPFDNGNGYLVVSLNDERGNRKNFYVHRLVADAFIPNPENLPQVDHIDYDRKNNKVTNLRWVTVSENALHSSCNKPKTHNICDSSTGYKYIYKRRGKYRVGIYASKGCRVDKQFSTLEEAVAYRDVVIKELGIEVQDNHNKIS